MNNLKKLFCSMFTLVMLPLTACTPSNVEEYRLNIKDSNDIILNFNKLTEPNKNYGVYKKGEEITFEILFFSGVSATLSIDEEIYQPIYDEAWKNGYVKYVMPDHDVNVVSLINGYDGEKIKPTGTFKLTIIDDGNYIYDKPKDSESYFAPGNEIKLHSHVIMDAYLAMYVDGEYHSRQTNVETDQGTIWEFTFIMPIGEATLEFKVEGGIW